MKSRKHRPIRKDRRRHRHSLRALRSINIPPFQTGTKPGNDFYAFVNGHWLRTTAIPAHKSTFSVSEEIERIIDTHLERRMREAMAAGHQGGPIGRMATSALQPQKQRQSAALLRTRIQCISSLQNESALIAAIGDMCRKEIPTFVQLSVGIKRPDATPGIWRLNILPGSMIGLPDVGLYKDKDALEHYVALVQRICRELGVEDCSHAIPLEAKYLKEIDRLDVDGKDYETDVKTVRLADLLTRQKEVFGGILAAYGVSDAHSIDTVPPFLEIFCELLDSAPFEDWKALLALHEIIYALPFLPPPYDNWHHSFFQKMLEGQAEKEPQQVLALEALKEFLPVELGHAFLKRIYGGMPDARKVKTAATAFVETLRQAAKRRFEKVKWLSPESKKKAKEKLDSMMLCVGFSDGLEKGYPGEDGDFSSENFLANIYKAKEASTTWYLERLSEKEAAPDTWLEPPYVVNAFYSHTANQIILPAGSIQWPFYHSDDANWRGWNYGALGAMVAHEIVHAFDPDEAKEHRWPARNVRRLEKKTADVIRLYSRAGRKEGVGSTPPLDIYESKYENLSDLGGMAIALDALRDCCAGLSAAEQARQFRDFFIGYAVSWRTKEASGSGRFKTVHAPAKFRVNVVVPQFQEWYDAFGVKPGESLYVAPEKRLQIY